MSHSTSCEDCETCRAVARYRGELPDRQRPPHFGRAPLPRPRRDLLDRLIDSPWALFVGGMVVLYILGYR